MKSMKWMSLLVALSCFACRSDGDDDGDAGDDNTDDGAQADDSIFEVQSDDMPEGTAVTLRDVVVVGVDSFGADGGHRLFVMEPEGGPFSGVLVFLRDGNFGDVAVGDLVDVEGGVKEEFAFSEDPSGRSVTEISPAEGGAITITKTGADEIPEPELLVPWELAADPDEAEKWEGVLIKFENVRVLGGFGQVGDDETRVQTDVTGPFQVQSDLISFEGIAPGDCFASMTGIGDYFFRYKILPRSGDDLEAGEEGDCLPPESGDVLCDDGEDNDHNGKSDCADAACIDSVAACAPTEATVVQIQSGEIAEDEVVALTDVVVTAVDREEGEIQNFWVQDGNTAAANGGVNVFWPVPAGELPEGVVVGARLDMQATVSEFPCLEDACAANPVTELQFATILEVREGEEEPVPLAGIGLDVLATDPAGEPYEGVLVTIANVSAISANDRFGVFVVGDGTTELTVENDIFQHTAVVDECYATLTGVMHRSVFEGNIVIMPRSAADVVTGDTCP
jgi:hypothetical protein